MTSLPTMLGECSWAVEKMGESHRTLDNAAWNGKAGDCTGDNALADRAHPSVSKEFLVMSSSHNGRTPAAMPIPLAAEQVW